MAEHRGSRLIKPLLNKHNGTLKNHYQDNWKKHSRKYFTQFYKCNPINNEGAEQLLLDAQMLKTILVNLPYTAQQIKRQALSSYSKVITKGMTKAEIILKVVMTPIDPQKKFIDHSKKLLAECQLSGLEIDSSNIQQEFWSQYFHPRKTSE